MPNYVLVLTKEDLKHIKEDFCSVAWAMPQGGTWGAGVPRGIILFKNGHVAYQIDGDEE